MNVSTTTSSTSSTADVSSIRSQATSTTKTSETSEKSFDEEMKTQSEEVSDSKNSETSNKSENKTVEAEKSSSKEQESSDNLSENDDLLSSDLLSGIVNFSDFKYNNQTQNLLSQNIQTLLDTKDLMNTVQSASNFDYDVVNMSDSDANFFVNLVQNTDMSMKSISSQISNEMVNNSENIQSNVQVSTVLMEKLADSMKTNQPFRIDFDKDVSVIIKVNKDGSIMANFIPGDKAVEQYLRNNISSLRQRFDDENLSYSELSYSNSRGQQQKRKKENDNE